MNAIVIGSCPKTVEQLSSFCESVHIVLDKSYSTFRSLPEYEKFHIINSDGNTSVLKGILPRAREIKEWVEKYDVEIVFTNTKWDMVAAKIASLQCRKKPFLISTNHNSYSWLSKRNVLLMSVLIRLCTDCYVALATFVYDKLLRLSVKPERMVIVPNTVGYETWQVKTSYDAGPVFRMVYVADGYYGKRQDLLADVLNEIGTELNVHIDCYGAYIDEEQSYEAVVRDKIKRYGLEDKMILKGKIENSELRNLLCEYDAYISPSHMEMSPVNILEAQAAGLPVIAANVGGIPDVIEDGITGLLFDADNQYDAKDKVLQVITDEALREKLGRNARKYVSEVYTKNEAGQRILERYLSLR